MTNEDKMSMIIVVVFGMLSLFAFYNLYTHWHIIFSLLNRDMQVYRMTLNIIEDHEPAFWAKDHKQRIEWMNRYPLTFPPGLYIKCKPLLLEKWHDDEVVLVRLDQRYHPQSDEKSHLSITRECRFITYHNRLPDTDMQYTQITALVFNCGTVVGGLERLIENIYKKTSMPIITVSRPIQRVYLYHESRSICLSRMEDLGFTQLLNLFDAAKNSC